MNIKKSNKFRTMYHDAAISCGSWAIAAIMLYVLSNQARDNFTCMILALMGTIMSVVCSCYFFEAVNKRRAYRTQKKHEQRKEQTA